jgi:hypothetical protein
MKRAPLDDRTYQAAKTAMDGAARHGWDVIEVLHEQELIMNPAAVTRIRLEAVMTLIKLLEEAKPHELLRRKFRAGAACTPEDMIIAVLDFINEYWEMIKKEGS